jgi:hypothetical protein
VRLAKMILDFQKIYDFFNLPSFRFLKAEESVAFIVATLYDHDSYGTELAKIIAQTSHLGISDTILYTGLDFLIESGLITAYNRPSDPEVKLTKGRPPIYYKLNLAKKNQTAISDLKGFWETKYPDVSLKLVADTKSK